MIGVLAAITISVALGSAVPSPDDSMAAVQTRLQQAGYTGAVGELFDLAQMCGSGSEACTAIQSGVPYASHGPMSALDGSALTGWTSTCTHTDTGNWRWWQVDLGQARLIHKVKVFPTTHNGPLWLSQRLTNGFTVRVGNKSASLDVDGKDNDVYLNTHLCGWEGWQPGDTYTGADMADPERAPKCERGGRGGECKATAGAGKWNTVECSPVAVGRYVSIDISLGPLSVCEVEVLGEEAPTPAPTPFPTPFPTPLPTPLPTPVPPTPWPEALENPQAKAKGELGFQVQDANALVSNPKALASVEEAVALVLGVSAHDVNVIRYRVGDGDWVDVDARALHQVGYPAQTLSKALSQIVVDYEVAVENVEAATALTALIEALTPTDVAVALTKSMKKNNIEDVEISADGIDIATPVVEVPTPAPPSEEASLDGKSADNAPEEDGKKKKKKKKQKQQASCFPGDAVVQVSDRGHVLISEVLAGDSVLSKPGTYEPVLGLVHDMRSQPAEFLTVVHELGKLRATANHIVFANEVDMLVANVLVGDHLFVGDAKAVVLSVKRSIGSYGMFAPLTPSGTIVVDDVLASTYAGSSKTMSAPHVTAHTIAFPARLYHVLQQALTYLHQQPQKAHVKEYHPYLRALCGPLSDLQSRLLA